MKSTFAGAVLNLSDLILSEFTEVDIAQSEDLALPLDKMTARNKKLKKKSDTYYLPKAKSLNKPLCIKNSIT